MLLSWLNCVHWQGIYAFSCSAMMPLHYLITDIATQTLSIWWVSVRVSQHLFILTWKNCHSSMSCMNTRLVSIVIMWLVWQKRNHCRWKIHWHGQKDLTFSVLRRVQFHTCTRLHHHMCMVISRRKLLLHEVGGANQICIMQTQYLTGWNTYTLLGWLWFPDGPSTWVQLKLFSDIHCLYCTCRHKGLPCPRICCRQGGPQVRRL